MTTWKLSALTLGLTVTTACFPPSKKVGDAELFDPSTPNSESEESGAQEGGGPGQGMTQEEFVEALAAARCGYYSSCNCDEAYAVASEEECIDFQLEYWNYILASSLMNETSLDLDCAQVWLDDATWFGCGWLDNGDYWNMVEDRIPNTCVPIRAPGPWESPVICWANPTRVLWAVISRTSVRRACIVRATRTSSALRFQKPRPRQIQGRAVSIQAVNVRLAVRPAIFATWAERTAASNPKPSAPPATGTRSVVPTTPTATPKADFVSCVFQTAIHVRAATSV